MRGGPSYNVGDVAVLSIEFRDAAGQLADPTTVRLTVKKPSGARQAWVYGTDSALVKDAVGKYHLDYSITVKHRHEYRWEGTGAVQAAEQNYFDVEAINT